MPATTADYQAVAAALDAAESVCIVTHLRPDADAIGSAMALQRALRSLGKRTTALIGQSRPVSENLLTIPGAEEIATVGVLPAGYELYVTVDCGSIDRTGLVCEGLAGVEKMVCIDHHSTNEGFGHVNLVDVDCESTTVVLLRIFDLLGVELDEEIAHCLYAGLVTDTGNFRWGRPEMHEVAHRLLGFGLNPKQITQDLLDATTPADLQMIGHVLAGLQVVTAGELQLGVLVAPLSLTGDASEAAVESLVDFVRALRGTQVGVTLKEQRPGTWAVSLRSSIMDCSEVATALGGGGHVPAAGFTAHGPAEEVIALLVSEVEKVHVA